jgi:ABC-type Zn2+ transport system substrate-binding protein/surface adhesin
MTEDLSDLKKSVEQLKRLEAVSIQEYKETRKIRVEAEKELQAKCQHKKTKEHRDRSYEMHGAFGSEGWCVEYETICLYCGKITNRRSEVGR